MNDEVRVRNVVDADEYLKVVVENKILKQKIARIKSVTENSCHKSTVSCDFYISCSDCGRYNSKYVIDTILEIVGEQ